MVSRERPSSERWIVEAVEDGVAILILADEEEELVVGEVEARLLGAAAEPGAVLDVPLGEVGEPVWERAVPVEEADDGGAPSDSDA